MKTSLAITQRLLMAGALSVGTILSHALTQQQDSGTPRIGDAQTGQSTGNEPGEAERAFYGHLFPLYDLLSAGSGRANAATLPASGQNEVSSAVNETGTSPDRTFVPEAEDLASTIAPKAQPLALLIRPEQGRESSGAGEASDSERGYILVFDPDDARSQLAYQVAQAMAQTNQLLDEELQASQPESKAAAEVLENPPPIERVKVTGRLLQNIGLEAIAVTHVERAVNLRPLSPLLEERQKKAAVQQPPAPQR
jgi:hypothetical protein